MHNIRLVICDYLRKERQAYFLPNEISFEVRSIGLPFLFIRRVLNALYPIQFCASAERRENDFDFIYPSLLSPA